MGAVRVALMGPTSIEWIVTDLAVLPWSTGANYQGVNFVSYATTFQTRMNSRLASELPGLATAGCFRGTVAVRTHLG